MGQIKCRNCNQPITNKTEVEYSDELTSYFCDPDCATNYYFEYMGSGPFQFGKDEMENHGVIFKKGKLYEKD